MPVEPGQMSLPDMLRRERKNARWRLDEITTRIKRMEKRIARDSTAAAKVEDLEREREILCRDLVEIVDDCPPGTWPDGWKITPDEVKP